MIEYSHELITEGITKRGIDIFIGSPKDRKATGLLAHQVEAITSQRAQIIARHWTTASKRLSVLFIML